MIRPHFSLTPEENITNMDQKDIYTEISNPPRRSLDSLTRVTNNVSIFNGRSANLIIRRQLQNGTTRTFHVEPTVLAFLVQQRERIMSSFRDGEDFVIKRRNVAILYFSRNGNGAETWMAVRPTEGPAFNLRRSEYTGLMGLMPYINSAILEVSINNIPTLKYILYCIIFLFNMDLMCYIIITILDMSINILI